MLDPTAIAVGQVNYRGLPSDVGVGATGNNCFKTETQQEPINEALQQLQARNVQLEAELNLIKFHNETLSHKITRLEQTSEKNELEQISETFQRLRAHKFQLEKELKFAKLHNETLSHHMAECEQAFDNEIQRLKQQCKQLCEQKDQEYDAVVEVIIEMNENLEQLKRDSEEQEHLLSTILEDNRRFGLLQARQAGDVAFEGSSAAVGEGNASDCSEVEPEADEQPGPFPYLQESDSEDSSDDEFFDALDQTHIVNECGKSLLNLPYLCDHISNIIIIIISAIVTYYLIYMMFINSR